MSLTLYTNFGRNGNPSGTPIKVIRNHQHTRCGKVSQLYRSITLLRRTCFQQIWCRWKALSEIYRTALLPSKTDECQQSYSTVKLTSFPAPRMPVAAYDLNLLCLKVGQKFWTVFSVVQLPKICRVASQK